MKKFRVTISNKYSLQYVVSANNKLNAKHKAIDKHKSKKFKQSDYDIDIEEGPSY